MERIQPDTWIQKDNKGAKPKRARYVSSMMDTDITDPGEEAQALNEAYVIFITEHDVLGGKSPIYHIDRSVREMNHNPFGDESHIIYVNGEITDGTELGRLMHDFKCTSAGEMYNKVLAERVRYYKEDEEGKYYVQGG